MDETAGTIESEIWALAATVYSLLAGRSPFEIPGESNKSTDLISRINRAKPEAIGRTDVPRSLERALAKAMSRKPASRPTSVLELIHEFQAVETELGVPQTPIEVAMDDWARATVADLEDRTRVRGIPGASHTVANRRRRRRSAAALGEYNAVGTLVRHTAGGKRSTGTRPVPQGKGMQALAWGLVASAVLVIALGATATLVLIKANSDSIPVVSNITAKMAPSTVEFSWSDPGIDVNDSYQITMSDGGSSVQRSPQFVVDTRPGEHVCITVTVHRGGKLGAPSSEKCADVPR